MSSGRIQPRFLDESEIEDIVGVIPLVRGADKDVAESVRNQIQSKLKEQLKEIEIVPLAIEELKQEIIQNFYKSQVDPGTMVGVTAAEALGGPLTQMALNSLDFEEKIVIIQNDKAEVLQIGEWIDSYITKYQSEIINIPENRTELLDITKQDPIYIQSVSEDGVLSWQKVSAIMRHLPVGDLVKIKTKSGRTVTATQQKSFLIYQDGKIVPTNGSDLKVGDLIPVTFKMPNYTTNEVSVYTKKFGVLIGKYLADESDKTVKHGWTNKDGHKIIPAEMFVAPLSFVKSLVNGYFNNKARVKSANRELMICIMQLCARLGKFCTIEGDELTINQSDYKPFNDVMLDPIETIELVKSTTQYVYDLTIPGNLTFATFSGINCMDSFHSSGLQKHISSGVERIKELVNLTPNPKRTSCSIYFNEHTTFEDVILKRRGDIVGLLVSDVIADYDVDTPDAYFTEVESENYVFPWWYNAFTNVIRNDFEMPRYMLRLYLNVNTMYAYRVTPQEVCEAIERETVEKGSPPSVVCVYSPLSEIDADNRITIDVLPIEAAVLAALKDQKNNIEDMASIASLVFLTTSVVPNFDEIQIKGVSGIRAVYPVTLPVLSVIKDQIVENKSENLWLLHLNTRHMKATGITYESVINLIRVAGLEILSFDPMQEKYAYMYIRIRMKTDEKPLDYIKSIVDADEKNEKEYLKDRRQAGELFPRRPLTPIAIAAKFVYIDTAGTNLKLLFTRDDIDTTHTISNDVHEILRTLGIEAARSFLIRELIRVISIDGSYINPRHIVLLVEFMTNQGRLNPITYSGIQRQPIGSLDKATFERSMDVLKEAGAFGRKQPITSVSSSIYAGKQARIGTGYTSTSIQPAYIEAYRERYLKPSSSEVTKVDTNTFRDALSQMEDISFGTGAVTFEGAEIQEMFGNSGELTPSLLPSVTISEDNYPSPIETHPLPVISQQLLNVAATIQQAPCLRTPPTVVSVQSSPPTVPSYPVGPSTSPQITIDSVVQLPPNNTGVGMPPVLATTIQAASQANLPPIPQQPPQPPATQQPPQRRIIRPADLGKFLS